MNLSWIDFNIGMVVETKNGHGAVMLVDRRDDKIGVQLLEGEYKIYKIDEISLPFGSMNISITQHIGQYILLFQRVENRLRDMINYVLDLKSVQKDMLTASFTAGKLIDKINSLIKSNVAEEKKNEWKEIHKALINHNKIRNTIIHGYLFHYNENHELDFSNIKIENANGNVELLNFEKLEVLNRSVVELYYKVHNLFALNSSEIKEKINKSR